MVCFMLADTDLSEDQGICAEAKQTICMRKALEHHLCDCLIGHSLLLQTNDVLPELMLGSSNRYF